MSDSAEVSTSCSEGCHWVHKVKGGQPLSVAVCSQCAAINWPLLAIDFGLAAKERAREIMEQAYGRHDYPDGSRTICATGMINVKQVYNLFAKDPEQDGCNLPQRPVSTAVTRAADVWAAVDSKMGLSRCPTCDSHNPRLHPALQADGGEVQICPDDWHSKGVSA